MLKTTLIVAMACTAQAFAPSPVHGFVKPISARPMGLSSAPVLARKPLTLTMSSTPAPAAPPQNFLPPPALYKAMANTGGVKATMSWWKTLYMGILAGVYIGFGSCLALSVGGACQGLIAAGNLGMQKIIMGAFGLPFGLLMVTVGGAELFTGNTAALTAAYAEDKATVAQIAKNWFWSYLGNFIGSLLLVSIVFHSGALAAPSVATVKAMTVMKTGLSFNAALLRGVLCNWLVCMGVWQAAGSTDIGSKALAIWFPISAFVAMGFEHSVANMFFLPMGILQGAEVSWKAFLLSNLLPVTLGNMIAGSLFVAGSYALMFGTPGEKVGKLLGK